MAKKNKNAQPLSKTIPGGYYIGADGKAHDANGKPIKTGSDDEQAKKEGGAGDNGGTSNPPQE